MKKLPQQLFVRWDGKDLDWLNADTTADALLESASDQKTLGVYELKRTVVAKSTVAVSVREKTSSRRTR